MDTATPAPLQTSPVKETNAVSAGTPLTAEPPIPVEAVGRFDAAVSLMSATNTEPAEREFAALAAAYPAYAGALLNLGILQARSGKLDAAERSLKGAIERNANSAPAYNQLGIVYRKLGRFNDADQAYQRAVQLDANYATAYLNLGVLCDLYLQQPQRALEAYERYLQLATTPDEKVSAWVKELKSRLGGAPQSAKAE